VSALELDLFAPPAVVAQAEVDQTAVYVALDAKVDEAEGDGVMARWEFGRRLLAERTAHGGNQLPHGRIEEICAVIAKRPTEVRSRIQFAEEYDTAAKVADALVTFASWRDICRNLGQRGLRMSISNEWYTPAAYVEAARDVLGGIDLDPASSVLANQTVRAGRIFTADDDGLQAPWRGRVWMNPPYGGLAGSFVAKLLEHHEAGEVPAAVVLASAHATDTEWFGPLFRHTLCFTDHRIHFTPVGRPASSANHGSVFVYLGPEPARFAQHFQRFGHLVKSWWT
jgi:DNA N-6-adenine-methyltransferase (Dam)